MKPRPAGLENGTESPAVYIQQDVLEELWFNARWRTDRLSVGHSCRQSLPLPERRRSLCAN